MAHELPELSEPSQQEVFTKQMCHPVLLSLLSDDDDDGWQHRRRCRPDVSSSSAAALLPVFHSQSVPATRRLRKIELRKMCPIQVYQQPNLQQVPPISTKQFLVDTLRSCTLSGSRCAGNGEGAGGDRKRSFQVYSDPQSGRVGPLNRVREGNEGR